MCSVNQGFGDTVGKKGLAGADRSRKQEIAVDGIELRDETSADINGTFIINQILSLEIFVGQGVEIFFFQDIRNVGLAVEQGYDALLKTVAFFTAVITAVVTVRAVIMHLQIISGQAVFTQQRFLTACQLLHGMCQFITGGAVPVDQPARKIGGKGSCRFLKCTVTFDLGFDVRLPLLQLMTFCILLIFVFPENGFVLCV